MSTLLAAGSPGAERPRERLRRLGPPALAADELIALILGTGTRDLPVAGVARSLVAAFGGLRRLGRASLDELAQCPGIGPSQAARLLAALELGRRREVELRPPPVAIRSAVDVYARFGSRLRDEDQEAFWVLHLDVKGRVRSEREVTRGVLDGSIVHPREVFGPALREAVASIVLVHNHPSGDPTPSADDVRATERLAAAGDLVGIRVLDHVVIGDGRFVSMAERGLVDFRTR